MSLTEVFFFVGTRQGEQNEPERGASRSRSAVVVAMKVGNQPDGTQWSEGRHRKSESKEGTMEETSSSQTVSTKLDRIANMAKTIREAPLTTLAHHIDVDWLREAHRLTRKDGAKGVDGQSAKQYAERLEENLQSLLDRVKSGTYQAPPVRRVNIPKGDGSQTRAIGIPTFEDKILQRALQMLLEAIYEQSFRDCSYGFRPGRSAHQALSALRNFTMAIGGGWVLEADIKGFFDALDHGHLRTILHKRVRDGVILRLIGKWLNAGVMEGFNFHRPETGTPQGGVISPLLANIYLHEVLDEWFAKDVQPTLKGAATLIRYADDFVIVFAMKEDAERVLNVLPKRFGEYGLTLHPEKTRLVAFQRPKRGDDADDGSESFDLLGFTHHWGLSLKGNWVVKKRTAKDRFTRALCRIREWCRRNRHLHVKVQRQALTRKLNGHYSYFAVNGNDRMLKRFFNEVERVWHKWLSRRSQRAKLSWEKMQLLLERYWLPRPRILHPFT
jgi:RNA-directed DNA polymerase